MSRALHEEESSQARALEQLQAWQRAEDRQTSAVLQSMGAKTARGARVAVAVAAMGEEAMGVVVRTKTLLTTTICCNVNGHCLKPSPGKPQLPPESSGG